MMPRLAPAAALAALLLAALAPSPAQAFCRTWSCKPSDEPGKTCPADPQNKDCPGGDPTRHHALYWPQKCIGFSLHIAPNAVKLFGTSTESAQAKVTRIADLSFASWQKASCGGGQTPSLAFYDLGFTECNVHEFNNYDPDRDEIAQGNQNLIVIHDKWPYAASLLAYTSATFSTDSGEIYDADIEVNGTKALTTADANPSFDLQSILTHEIGYFLGLSNSKVEGSVMFSPPAEKSIEGRTLKADDVAGVCAVYPPDRTGLPACDPTPRHGLGATCGNGEALSDGCAVVAPVGTRSPRSPLPALGALGALAGAVVLRLRGLHRGRARR